MQYSMPRTSFHLTVGQSFLPSPDVPPIVATGQSTLLHQMQPVGTSPYGQLAVVPSSPSTIATYATGQSSYLPPSQQTYIYTESMTTPLDHKPFAAHRRAISLNRTMDQKPFAAWRTSSVSPVFPHLPVPPSHVPVPPSLGYTLPSVMPYQRVTSLSHSHCRPVESFCELENTSSRSQLPASPLDPLLMEVASLNARPSTPRGMSHDQGNSRQVFSSSPAGMPSYPGVTPSYSTAENQQPLSATNVIAAHPIPSSGLHSSYLPMAGTCGISPTLTMDLVNSSAQPHRPVISADFCTEVTYSAYPGCKKSGAGEEFQENIGTQATGDIEQCFSGLKDEEVQRVRQEQEELMDLMAKENTARMETKGASENVGDNDAKLVELDEARQQIARFTMEGEEMRRDLDKLREETRTMKERESAWLEQLHGAKVELASVFQEREENVILVTKLTEALKEQQSLKERAEQKNKELHGQLQKMKEATEKERVQSFLESEVTNLRQECQSLRRETERSLEVVKDEMDALRNDLDGLKERSSKFQPQVPEKEHEGNGSGSDYQGNFRSESQ